MKRFFYGFILIFTAIGLSACTSDSVKSVEEFFTDFQTNCPEITLSFETENIQQTDDGITHTLFAGTENQGEFLIEILTDEITGDIKKCTVICPQNESELLKEFEKICTSAASAFTDSPLEECGEFLNKLPLLIPENDNSIHKITFNETFIFRSFPAAGGYAFTIEDSELVKQYDTTALSATPPLNPVTMETLPQIKKPY